MVPPELIKDEATTSAIVDHLRYFDEDIRDELRAMEDFSRCQRKARWMNVIAMLRAEATYIETMLELK
jgi:hypothetical protein